MTVATPSDRLHDLLPSIRARRAEIEEGRRLPPDLADALRATGVYGLAVPRALGGGEGDLLDILRTIEAVAGADGSTGWCVMVGIGNNVASGYMAEAGARVVFADPGAPTAAIAAPSGRAVRVEGGVRVEGRWSFASGITHSDWVWAGCVVMRDGKPRMSGAGPEIVHVCMPVRDVEIHDTWHTSGLRGTGSQDFSAAGVFVPDERTFALLDPAGHRTEPLYRMPPLGVFVFQLVCVSLGIARAALDELVDLAQTKVPTLSPAVLADRPATQIALARAEVALGGARAFLYERVGAMWTTVRAGGAPTGRELAMARLAATAAAGTAAEVTRTASVLAGGGSVYSSSSLQRHARDAEAVTHHFTVAPHTWEDGGRILLGRDPVTAVF